MTFRGKIKITIQDFIESFNLSRSRKNEIRKFKDFRRIEIANEFPLTNSQKKQIDDFYISNYGEKIDYVWHQNYAAHAEKFDYRFFPELLYIPEFEAYQNTNKAIIQLLNDKNFLPLVAKSVGIKMPKTIVSCTNGVLRDVNNHFINDEVALGLLESQKTDCFVKPTRETGSGVGCSKISNHSRFEIRGGENY